MSLWKTTLVELPTDAAVVWIRRVPFFDTPVLATFDATNLLFITNDTSIAIPAYAVHSWKPQ